MKIAMTGGRGRIGKRLANYGVIDLECDVTKLSEISSSLEYHAPDVIIHLAAKSDVDYCEKPENQATVIQTNLRGTYNICDVAEKAKIPVVMLSSDHVFDGKGFFRFRAYAETATPNPINFYGQSKMAAEGLMAIFDNLRVVRTSYLFDEERLKPVLQQKSFPDFIYRSFMHSSHFVHNLLFYVRRLDTMPNLMHITSDETISWSSFMSAYLGRPVPTHSKDNQEHAPRPAYGGLRTLYLHLLPQYSYQEGIEEMRNK